MPGILTEHTYIENEFDELARLTGTTLKKDVYTNQNWQSSQLNLLHLGPGV